MGVATGCGGGAAGGTAARETGGTGALAAGAAGVAAIPSGIATGTPTGFGAGSTGEGCRLRQIKSGISAGAVAVWVFRAGCMHRAMNSGTMIFKGRVNSRLSRADTAWTGAGLIHARNVLHEKTACPRFSAD